MTTYTRSLRKATSRIHLWLGLAGGLLFCLMALTGGIVSFRPQLALWMAPSSAFPQGCSTPVDWNRAEQQVTAFAHARINRIYGPLERDPRYHFRMATDEPIIFTHIIYDACAGKVLASVPLQWMDWIVDLHHNLLAGRTGRNLAGGIGLALFLSAAGGWLLWLLSNPSLETVFRIRGGVVPGRTSRDLHRTMGLTAGTLLLLGAFTALWLCFPQTMRALLAPVALVPADVRPARRARDESGRERAGLAQVVAAAEQALPGGSIREIRLPEGNGNVQIRMWLPGDFRALGNNVIYVDSATARVLGVDLYSAKPPQSRFVQAMAGLHYGEWGGLGFRTLYGIAGFAAAALFITGFLIWWLPRKARPAQPSRELAVEDAAATH